MTIAHRLATRLAVLIAALIGAAMLAVSVAPVADAAGAYRFWGYFQLKDGKWAFAQKGADQIKPTDGSVEGWRFALAAQTDTRMPRDTPSFKETCQGIKAKSGTKRVGVVLDFGRTADAESGKPPAPVKACAQVPTDATGSEVLAKAVVNKVRTQKGMTCGILGWPKSGCGDQVKDVPAAAKAKDKPVDINGLLGTSSGPTTDASPQATGSDAAETKAAAASDSDDDDSSSAPLLIGGGVVIVLVLAGVLVLAQRRRKGAESA